MRRRKAVKRKIESDPVFNSLILGKFINIIMFSGKKAKSSKIIYDALDVLQKRLEDNPLKIFYKALDNARPRVVVKPRRIGGATYQVPVEVDRDKGYSIAMHWIRDYSRGKKGKSMSLKLADELTSAYKGEGALIKKRDDTHRMAEANKAFARFRF